MTPVGVILVLVSISFGVLNAQTPFVVPYLGINNPPHPPEGDQYSSSANCQMITGVSDVEGFGFWVSIDSDGNNGPNDFSITGRLGYVATTGEISFGATKQAYNIAYETYSDNDASSYFYAAIGVAGLNPTSTYAICMQMASANCNFSFVSTQSPEVTSTGTGGFTLYQNSSTGAYFASQVTADLFFTVISTNRLVLLNTASQSSYTDFMQVAQSYSSCIYRATWSAIRVDWQAKQINTGYNREATVALQYGSNCPVSIPYRAPVGQPSNCNSGAASYNNIDLRGTGWAFVPERWNLSGWGYSGAVSYNNNNQVVNGWIQGLCSLEATSEEARQDWQVNVGGFFMRVTPAASFC